MCYCSVKFYVPIASHIKQYLFLLPNLRGSTLQIFTFNNNYNTSESLLGLWLGNESTANNAPRNSWQSIKYIWTTANTDKWIKVMCFMYEIFTVRNKSAWKNITVTFISRYTDVILDHFLLSIQSMPLNPTLFSKGKKQATLRTSIIEVIRVRLKKLAI